MTSDEIDNNIDYVTGELSIEVDRRSINQRVDEMKGRVSAEFITLLEQAKGNDRTFGKYAEDAGISPAAMSRIRNGQYAPSPTTLKKLTSDKARPRCDVTYNDMMEALGLIDRKRMNYDIPEDLMKEGLGSGSLTEESGASVHKFSTGNPEIDERLRKMRAFERDASSRVYAALFDKGIMFRKGVFTDIRRGPAPGDVVIEVVDQPINNWYFDFRHGSRDPAFLLGLVAMMNIKPDEKITYVLDEIHFFQRLKRYDHALSLRGELSVAFFDPEKNEIVEEVYLSNYFEGDRSREVYLVEK